MAGVPASARPPDRAIAQWLRTTRADIDALADPVRADGVRYAVPGARTNGAPVPSLRAIAKQIRGDQAGSIESACRLMDALCRSGSREDVLVGTFLVGRYAREAKALPWSRVAGWIRAIDNWETCDQLCNEVIAAMVDARPELKPRLLTLARSRNRWHRRIAVATAASLNTRGRSQPAITRAICAALAADQDPMIRRAVAWARRSIENAR